jgi:hypothetical protein
MELITIFVALCVILGVADFLDRYNVLPKCLGGRYVRNRRRLERQRAGYHPTA